MNPLENLQAFKKNITSQDGEDGILAEILRRLDLKNGWCVEFGAWDGKLLSNTWALWHNAGWQAILIEGDPEKYTVLESSMQSRENVRCIQKYVSGSGKNSLDLLLLPYNVPKNFDVLSIDIDGNDYYIWREVNQYKPKIVVIEFNSSIPPYIDLVGEDREDNRLGCSARALVRLATEKGYLLAACTSGNLIFVSIEIFHKLGIERSRLEDIFPYDKLTTIISNYDGALFATREKPVHASIETISGLRSQVLSKNQVPESLNSVALVSLRSENETKKLLSGFLTQGGLIRKALLGILWFTGQFNVRKKASS